MKVRADRTSTRESPTVRLPMSNDRMYTRPEPAPPADQPVVGGSPHWVGGHERRAVNLGGLHEVGGDDPPPPAGDRDLEVGRDQGLDWRAVVVDHLHVYGNEVDRRPESRSLLRDRQDGVRGIVERDGAGQDRADPDAAEGQPCRRTRHGSSSGTLIVDVPLVGTRIRHATSQPDVTVADRAHPARPAAGLTGRRDPS